MYILRPHAAGILYAPPFYTPPLLEGYFQGWGGWGCVKFGPVFNQCLGKQHMNGIFRLELLASIVHMSFRRLHSKIV